MPSCATFVRIIRRRVVLGLIFAVSLTYCAFSLLRDEKKGVMLDNDLEDVDGMMMNDNNEDLISDDDSLPEQYRASDKPSLWQLGVLNEGGTGNGLNIDTMQNLNENDTAIQTCRNSIQGKVLIVDERGVICARRELLPNGCCSTDQKETPKDKESSTLIKGERYSCKTCNTQGCCAVYEYCVSCCLHPAKTIKGRKDGSIDSGRKNGHKKSKDEDAVRIRLRNLDRFQVCLAACRTSSASVRHENTYKDPHSKHCYILQSPQSHHRHRREVSQNNNVDNQAVVVTSSSVVPLLTLPPTFCPYPSNPTKNLSGIFLLCEHRVALSPYYDFHLQPP